MASDSLDTPPQLKFTTRLGKRERFALLDPKRDLQIPPGENSKRFITLHPFKLRCYCLKKEGRHEKDSPAGEHRIWAVWQHVITFCSLCVWKGNLTFEIDFLERREESPDGTLIRR